MSPPRRRGVLEGALVVFSMLLVPFALATALRASITPGLDGLVDALVAVAAGTWSIVVWSLVGTVRHALRDGAVAIEPGPIGWAAVRVASLLLLAAPLLDRGVAPTMQGAPRSEPTTTQVVAIARRDPRVEASSRRDGPALPDPARPWRPADGHRFVHRRGGHRGRVVPTPEGGSVLVALAAELRRRRRVSTRVVVDDDEAIDHETSLLSAPTTTTCYALAAIARGLAAAGHLQRVAHVVVRAGEARLVDASWSFDPEDPQGDAKCLVVVLGHDEDGTHVVFVPRGASLALSGAGAPSLLEDALRVAPALGLGRPVLAAPHALLEVLALREDDDVVVCVGDAALPEELSMRAAVVHLDAADPLALVEATTITLHDGRLLRRDVLSPVVRQLLDGEWDRPVEQVGPRNVEAPSALRDEGCVVVRLLTAVPRVDGLAEPFEPGRERRAVELVAYLALRAGQPVTGERLRMRVLGNASTDAAAKTLFNIASSLRRSLGVGPLGPRLPPAGKLSRYTVAPDVVCDVRLLEARVAEAHRCSVVEEKMAWLRSALELVEAEPFATVLEGYDWFLTEGHLARLQTTCEDAACELAELAVARGLEPLARFALERARLVDPYSERVAAAAVAVESRRQASFDAIAPALRSTAPSAPTLT